MRFPRLLAVALSALLALQLTGCSKQASSTAQAPAAADASTKTLKFGVAPGPYDRLIRLAMQPQLEAQGYEVSVIEFDDYVQPNEALESGKIDANLMQSITYIDNMVFETGANLQAVTTVPTLGMTLFSLKVKSLNFQDPQVVAALQHAKVGIASDDVIISRALRFCRNLGLITFKEGVAESVVTFSDIDQNPFSLEFVTVKPTKLAYSLDSLTMVLVPGNFSYHATLDFSHALAFEKVREDEKNVIAVRKGDQDLAQLLFNVVRSPEFKQAVERNMVFKPFSRPEWWDEVGNRSQPNQPDLAPAANPEPAVSSAPTETAAAPAPAA